MVQDDLREYVIQTEFDRNYFTFSRKKTAFVTLKVETLLEGLIQGEKRNKGKVSSDPFANQTAGFGEGLLKQREVLPNLIMRKREMKCSR